jgi:ribose transport system ATP-binding protein
LNICDTITIMKDGDVVDTCPCSELNQDRLVSRMVGRELRYTFPQRAVRAQQPADTVLMEVQELASRATKHPVSLNLYQNEVLGIYGLEGQGQREFLRTLAGLETPISGSVHINGQPAAIKNPREAVRSGIAYTPADRKGEGLATDLSARMNIGMPALVRGRGSFVDKHEMVTRCEEQIKDLRIKVASQQTRVVNLSGGNQQKIVIGKWLSVKPQVLILDEPTRGIDVESKMEVYVILRQLADSGVGVIVLSSDLIELIGLCDRMMVFFEGQITGSLDHEEFTEERVMACATATNGHGEPAL